MKFEVSYFTGAEPKRKLVKLCGFTSLEDAAVAALAIANRRAAEETIVSIYLPRKRRHEAGHLDGVRGKWNVTQGEFVARCRHALELRKTERAQKDTRMAWLEEKERAMPAVHRRIFDNQEATSAFFKNDFAAVEKFLAETAPPVNPVGNTP